MSIGARRSALVLGVVALGLAAWAWPGRGGRWTRVRRGDLVITTEAVGQLESVEREALGPPPVEGQWEYKISFLAPEGKEVAAGEPVVGFDSTDLERRLVEQKTRAERAGEQLAKTRADRELELSNAKLDLAQAEAALGKARLKAEVPADLQAAVDLEHARIELEAAEREATFRRDAVAQLERRSAAELDALAGERDAARSRVARLQASLAAMRVVAPRAGTVVFATNWRGEKKKVGDSCWRGETVVELPRLDRLRGVLEVDEADAGRVAPGQRVRLRLDSRPELEFGGEIARVHTAVTAISRNDPRKVVRAEVTLDRVAPEIMRPAMRFRATIEIERHPGTLLLPQAALERRDGRPVVQRERWFGVETVAPELGRLSGDDVEVLSGLDADDAVRLPDEASREPTP